MKHEQILSIIDSTLDTDDKYHRIISSLCGRPIYEIGLIGLYKKGHGRIVKTKSFRNLKELKLYYEKLLKRKYPIYEAKLKIGYHNDFGKCYWF